MKIRAIWLPALCAVTALVVLPACRSTRRKCCPQTPAPEVADAGDADGFTPDPPLADAGEAFTPPSAPPLAPDMPLANAAPMVPAPMMTPMAPATPMAPPMAAAPSETYMPPMANGATPMPAPMAGSGFPVADGTPVYSDAPPATGEYVAPEAPPAVAAAESDGNLGALDERLRAAEERLRQAEDAIMNSSPPAAAPAHSAGGGSSLAQLESDLRSHGGTEVVRQGDMVIVRMTDAFRSGSDLLKQDAKLVNALNATASALKRYPNSRVNVVGHSDGQPIVKTRHKWRDNRHLSQARAERVAQLLTRNGVESGRIFVDGRGAENPLVPERSARDRAKNRRVEIMIKM